jgi:DNA transformation protein and related proteins
MAASEGFAEFLREQLAPLGRISMRRMFSKTGVFCEGVMLGMVADDTLYFRVDDENRAAFKEAEAYPPLNYEKQGRTIDLSFWRAPERLLDEPDELVSWARAALAAARRVAIKGKRPPANEPRPARAPRGRTRARPRPSSRR